MGERLFGVETEYALSMLGPGGARIGHDAVANDLLSLAQEHLVHLPAHGAAGIYLQQAGRLYVDCGEKLEFSTPECSHPDEVVRYVRAGERIVGALAARVAARLRAGAEPVVLRCNVDYSSAATWGCHESYLHRVDPAALPAQVIPHLVSRIIYTGAGGFNSRCPEGLEFTLSPRVWYLASDISHSSTCARGIFHTKDESLSAAGYHRLHALCGESLCADEPVWLKLGTTALVVVLVEAGVCPGAGVELRAPLEAMQRFARDPTCRATAEMVGSRLMSALDIQRHYLSLARRHARHALMPPWAEQVCDRWGAMLDRLETAPESVATQLDWAIKLELYRRHALRRGFAWEALSHWSHVAGRLHAALVTAKCRDLSPPLDRLLAADGPIASDVERLAPYLAAHGLRWEALPAFVRLRQELFAIDARFGQIGEKGIFSALDRSGVLAHGTVTPAEVERAVEEPPAVGRARVRGAYIRQLSGRGGRYSCDWRGVRDEKTHRFLDLSDPFATGARWVRCSEQRDASPGALDAASPVRRPSVASDVQMLHDCAAGLYRRWRYPEAARLFEQARQLALASGERRLASESLFWSATLLHGMGRLREAGAMLDRLARAPRGAVDDAVLYKTLTRRALLLLEIPRPLAEIERALRLAEEWMARLRHRDWGSRILLVRARLYAARGLYDAALSTALEGLEGQRRDAHPFAGVSHMRAVLSICLRSNRMEEAGDYIARWTSWQAESARPTEILFACGRSELARARGQAGEAVWWAMQAARSEEAGIERVIRVTVGETLVRALLCLGDLRRARAALRPLVRLRCAEAAEDRYATALLCADYRLASARSSAGLPAVDLGSRLEFDRTDQPVDPAAAAHELQAAQRSYRKVLREARRIDELLECRIRQDQVAGREAVIEATRARLAQLASRAGHRMCRRDRVRRCVLRCRRSLRA